MPNSALHTAISNPRYLRYLSACGNKRKALMLYRANIDISLKLYAVIGVFEIILRNTIDRHMIAHKGPNWLENAVAPGGYLAIHPECEKSFLSVQAAMQISAWQNSHDNLISKLSLGFWRHQFAAKEYAASNCNLLNIFTNLPPRIKQKDIYKRLMKINELRNRIAHHEPICFYGNLISMAAVETKYDTILELFSWLGCNPRKILYGIDKVPRSIYRIKKI
jgi:hypothetical protein